MNESIIKIVLILLIVLAAFGFVVIPRTKLSAKFKMGAPMFIFTNIIGIIIGAIGLIVLFLIPDDFINLHLWELIAMPYALVWIYWLMIMRIRKSTNIVDEKQEHNMTKAAALTLPASIFVFAVIFKLSNNSIVYLSNGLWFPFYLFISIVFFSVFTLWLFKVE
ncbi:MAG TPA: hypothetical protein ENN22_00270 [bacterium]|nr:hypothetical protein [bacterium]